MNKCKVCDKQITWADQRRQFARLIERGFTNEDVKQSGPRCQKCNTVFLGSYRGGHGQRGRVVCRLDQAATKLPSRIRPTVRGLRRPGQAL
jgi:hypothetical protein